MLLPTIPTTPTTPTTFLAIGCTGFGKSTIGQLLCDVDTDVKGVASSTLCEATLFENKDGSFRYIDTAGLNDSGGLTDEDTFHNILRLLQQHSKDNIFNIHKILWFCAESVRKTANLQKEAKFIQRLSDYIDKENDRAKFWKNVLIVTKGTFPLEDLNQGPISAAYDTVKEYMDDDFENIFTVDHFPCWIFDLKPGDKKFSKMNPEDRIEMFNAYSKDEIKTALQKYVNNDSIIKIKFIKTRCKKCVETGDPRLFIDKCHPLTREKRHDIENEQYHPKPAEWQHVGKRIYRHWNQDDEVIEKPKVDSSTVGAATSTVGSLTAGAYALNIAAAAQPGIFFGGGAIAGTIALPIVAAVGLAAAGGYFVHEKIAENYKCQLCNKKYTEKGCIEECDQCNKKWDNEKGCILKHACCNKPEEESGCNWRERCLNCGETDQKLTTDGCKEYCQRCEKEWGKSEGCESNVQHDIDSDIDD
ncbi:7972_t:CDS:1 [Funneliformis geosporum]|uniref:13505_t:CDS:1 n=1 Tax=Funneliformis geosporum TaxID=1117311 RepID=A0A9W4WWK8_9GLOM|nr:7972_t:CDS:1 [Funneliformis geosporum]CAI2192074.1 13505_t:CDS:1 [Funneliformis geosporum]